MSKEKAKEAYLKTMKEIEAEAQEILEIIKSSELPHMTIDGSDGANIRKNASNSTNAQKSSTAGAKRVSPTAEEFELAAQLIYDRTTNNSNRTNPLEKSVEEQVKAVVDPILNGSLPQMVEHCPKAKRVPLTQEEIKASASSIYEDLNIPTTKPRRR